jgi:ABC-type transport system involved in multi-copper enzyme maturation permease subunit
MLSLVSSSWLWAQAAAATPPAPNPLLFKILKWMVVWGDPSVTINSSWTLFNWGSIPVTIEWGPLVTFAKIVGLFSLLGWIGGWVISGAKDRGARKAKWLDTAALISILGLLAAVTVGQLQVTKRIAPISFQGISLAALIAIPFALVEFVWVERALWVTITRLGKRIDQIVLGLVHLALIAGVAGGMVFTVNVTGQFNWAEGISYGVRLGVTYMGLVVLARILYLVAVELVSIRARRLYAIAKLSVIEANRRMWAPWVVLVVFGVILAFTHWFLQPPEQRPAEVGRLYIDTLMVLCSLLITVLVSVLSPISLPQDIQNQTIFTVVSKPVRRIELIWGRMLGFMALVTVLIAIFGGISLIYLQRNVGGTIKETERQAEALAQTDPRRSAQLFEQADQLRTRMSARKPINGSLTFLDSKGNPKLKGIDVGQDTGETREPRSHIEGATPATAKWEYGIITDPYNPRALLDRRIPVDDLLKPGTIEYLENQALVREFGLEALSQGQVPGRNEAEKARIVADMPRVRAEVDAFRLESQKKQRQAQEFETKADAAEKAGKADEAQALRDEAGLLHSPPVQLEMTFTIYRTTKGRVGEPVFAELEVVNPNSESQPGRPVPRITQAPWRRIFPIREYYTNKELVPASYLVGSNGGMRIEVRCVSPTQYLGMAESDLYILKQRGDFGWNFAMGLAGIWLQAMVLTAIGVFAGTFLSWPMALLTTLAFYIAGQLAFSFFRDIAFQSLIGGGPFESLIRLVTHDNQMTELSPTLAVVVAKTLDALTMPVLTRLAYIVPNFGALDVTNTVAEGFEVDRWKMLGNFGLALAYALPFSIGGYFILKNREVAA